MGYLSSSAFQIVLLQNSKAHHRKNKISLRYDMEVMVLRAVYGSSLFNFTVY
jgi:hypothetical protein